MTFIEKEAPVNLKSIGTTPTQPQFKSTVNFLDKRFDRNTGLYKPYMLDNDQPLNVDSKSNHHPLVLKCIPLGVNKRLSKISANREIFESEKQPYQDALKRSITTF